MNKPQIIGRLDARVIELLQLSLTPGIPIFLGESNIEHMKKEHPDAHEKYFSQLAAILSAPTFVAKHPNKDSIEYIKVLDEHVLVAVRISRQGVLYARTLFVMTEDKVAKYRKNPEILKPCNKER